MIHIMPAIISMNNCINAMNTAHLLSEIEDNEEIEEEVLEVLNKDIPIELKIDFESNESIKVSDVKGEFLDAETFNKIIENAKNVGLITKDKYEDIHYK